MKKDSELRTDGTFGALYRATCGESGRHDLRGVIAMYRERVGCDYRTAWAAWFDWANGLPSRRETMEMLKNLEIG